MEALIAYYNLGEVNKIVEKLENLLELNGWNVSKKEIYFKDKYPLKKQFKYEKKLELNKKTNVKKFDLIILGTPIVSFSSAPAINSFIRTSNLKNKNCVLFATGIGLPGKAIKRMQSLLSMKGANFISGKVFSSIFEFDTKKLKEVESFFEEFRKELNKK